ncbi:pectinesterase inhibitor-like [Fagus crenata]
MKGSSFCASSLLISLLLAILCISPAQSIRVGVKIGEDVLTDLCSKTDDPSFCLQSLKSDPQTATTDLRGLAGVSINLAKTTVTKTHTFIKSQLEKTTDPQLKKQYSQCLDSYDDAIGNVDYASEQLSSSDYGGVSSAASACMTDISDCQDATSALPQQNKESNLLCKVTLLIANRLLGKV